MYVCIYVHACVYVFMCMYVCIHIYGDKCVHVTQVQKVVEMLPPDRYYITIDIDAFDPVMMGNKKWKSNMKLSKYLLFK